MGLNTPEAIVVTCMNTNDAFQLEHYASRAAHGQLDTTPWTSPGLAWKQDRMVCWSTLGRVGAFIAGISNQATQQALPPSAHLMLGLQWHEVLPH